MTNQCLVALDYIRAKSPKEKPVLFEYFFDRMFLEYFIFIYTV